jgi:hypothetical protein
MDATGILPYPEQEFSVTGPARVVTGCGGSVLGMPGIEVWPEWGRRSPVWGARLSDLPIPDDLKLRLTDWARIWNAGWGEQVPEWSDPRVGEAWIAEGEALIIELRAALGEDWTVDGDFAMYAPGATGP